MMQFFLILFLLSGPYLLEAKPRPSSYTAPDLDELRFEIEDLKQALHVTQVDLSILEEKNKKSGDKETHSISSIASQVLSLEKKVSSLEKILDKISGDLRTLNVALTQNAHHIEQVQTRLSSQDERLNEINKLKGTLTSIAKAVGERPSSKAATTYRVKAGDSLEKIAKVHQTTADTLRKINHLNSDKIVIGQELKVSYDPS